MVHGAQPSRAATPAEDRTPPSLRRVLVAVDLTAASDRVIGRVMRLPIAERGRVELLHVVPSGLSSREQRRTVHDARSYLADAADDLRASLPGIVVVTSEVEIGAAPATISRHALAMHAELVVTGRGHMHTLRDHMIGSTAERVIRRSRVPILVVRRPPRSRYLRPVVALADDGAASAVLAALVRVLPSPRPPLEVIHAVERAYVHAYPSLRREDQARYERDLAARALPRVVEMLASAVERSGAPADSVPYEVQIECGSSRPVIQRAVEQADADLLALGTRGRAGLSYALLGTIAGDVLRAVRCDVLVVPPP